MSLESILIIGALLLFAIALLAVNLAFITFALYNLGISGLFKTIEEVFEGKNKGRSAEDYLIYAAVISASIFVIFAIVIIAAIVIAVVGAPEEAGGAVVAGAAEEGGAAELLPGLNNMISGAIGMVLVIILIVVVLASTGSGILCFLAASEIKKDPKFDGKKELRTAYTDAIVAGIMGISIVAFAILGIIGYFVLRFYQAHEKAEAIKEAKAAKEKKLHEAALGLREALEIKSGGQAEVAAAAAAAK